MSALGPSSSPCNSFLMLFIHSPFPYFTSKSFCFFYIRLLVCSRAFSTYLLVEFSFVIWNALFCSHRLTLSLYLLNLSSFASIGWFIFSICIVWLVRCFTFVFSSHQIIACFFSLSTFDFCSNFFTCPSSLISHPGFVSILLLVVVVRYAFLVFSPFLLSSHINFLKINICTEHLQC